MKKKISKWEKQVRHSFANGETSIFPAPQLQVACIYVRIRGSITFHLNTW